MYTEDFFIRHRQLAESADKVLFIHTPRCKGKSWTDKLIRSITKPKYSHVYGAWIIDELFKRNPPTKLLHSKSKQSRIVRVVCKSI